MVKSFFWLVIAAFALASCVPTKDLIYLQDKGSVSNEHSVSAVPSKPYRLQVNDILTISIKASDPRLVEMFSPQLNENVLNGEQSIYAQGYSVDDHGNIRLPMLGNLNVLGYTVEEIRIKVEEKLLEEYFREEANIFVVVKLAGLRFTINGEILQPGTKLLYQDKVTIMEAIANSGDITITGDRKSVVIIRQYPTGTQMHTIDLTDKAAMSSPYYYLQPNDYIYIKPLPQKSWGTGTTGVQTLTTLVSLITLVTTTLLIITR